MRIILALILLVIVASVVNNQRITTPYPINAQPKIAESVAYPGCFAVEKFKAGVVNECSQSPCYTLNLTGKLRNNCSIPAGALIKITAEDSHGAVVDTFEGWPASIRNIEPSDGYSFNFGPGMIYQKNMAKFSVEVIDARTWR